MIAEGLLKVKLNTTSDPSVAEASEMVATVYHYHNSSRSLAVPEQ
jgi:hypothetical protein